MAALTADRITEMQPSGVVPYPVAAGKKIFAGAIVAIGGTGLAAPAGDTAGYSTVGVAVAQADNSAGADGAINVSIVTPVIARLDCVKTNRIYAGQKVYIVDDHTVGDVTTSLIKAGFVWIKVSDTDVWVLIDPAYTLS